MRPLYGAGIACCAWTLAAPAWAHAVLAIGFVVMRNANAQASGGLSTRSGLGSEERVDRVYRGGSTEPSAECGLVRAG